jgi:hypothetical protein
MNFQFFLKRQRISLETFIEVNNINTYEEFVLHVKSLSLSPPKEKELNYEFKKQDVEKRTIVKSSSKKKRVSNSKSKQRKANDSTSARRSRSKQPIRKSPIKRQRERSRNKVESVQPISGSESSK